MNRNVVVALLIAVMLVLGGVLGANMVTPTQAAVVTPIANAPSDSGTSSTVIFFNKSMTADETVCIETGRYGVAGMHVNLDMGTVNTTTVTLQYSNWLDTSLDDYVNGAVLANAVAVDTNTYVEAAIGARYTCVKVDVINANAQTVKIYGNLR